MAKLSQSEKRAKFEDTQISFNASYLELYRYELEKKREKKIAEYKKNNPEGSEEYENQLVEEDEIRLANKAQKLDKKAERKLKNYDKRIDKEIKRVWEIDFVRGLIIIGMLIDHFIGDFWMLTPALGIEHGNEFFTNMYVFSIHYWTHPARVAIRLLGVMLLLTISGISARFSRKSWLHGLLIMAFGGLMSAVFAVIAAINHDFSSNVMIGAITCIGLCLTIYSLVKLLFYKLHKEKAFKWVALGVALSILIAWGFLSYYNPDRQGDYNFWFVYNNYGACIKNIRTPEELQANWWKVLLGFNYFGMDWLALFPYLGYMFLGGFIGETVYKDKQSLLRFIPSKTERTTNQKFNHATKVVVFPGQKSMWFYLLHQVVYVIIIVLLALMMGLTIRL